MELNNGTLTLKSGSKTYWCDGSFTPVTTTQDVSAILPSYSYPENTLFYAWYYETGLQVTPANTVSSGAGTTGSGTWRFNTDDNKWYCNGTYYQRSIPVCTFFVSGTTITSINKIFNGYSLIGNSIITLPNFKVQFPNGRNADGTCKSNLYTQQNVNVYTNSWGSSSTGKYPLMLHNTSNRKGIYGTAYNYYFVSSITQLPATGCFFYDSETNLTGGIDSGSIYYSTYFYVGTMTLEAGVIKDVNIEPVESVVNSNMSNISSAGRSFISGLGKPKRNIQLTLGASGSTYIAPANGWFRVTANPNQNTYGRLHTSTLAPCFSNVSSGAIDIEIYAPVSKGEVVTYTYSGSFYNTNKIQFIYDEGE